MRRSLRLLIGTVGFLMTCLQAIASCEEVFTQSDPYKVEHRKNVRKGESLRTTGFSTETKWNNSALWDASIKHSNRFYLRNAWDRVSGSFATEISYDGIIVSDKRHLIAESRMIYGLAHGARIDSEYLKYAERAAAFLLSKMRGQDRFGPYFIPTVDRKGQVLDPSTKLVVNEQAYGLNGLVALYAETGDSQLLSEIEICWDSFKRRFYDPQNGGFFDGFDTNTGQPIRTKSYNSTVYVATSFLLELARIPSARSDQYVGVLKELADIVSQKFLDPKTGWIIENFTSDWQPDWRDWQKQDQFTIGVVGHNFQAAWFLMQVAQFKGIPEPSQQRYLNSARQILSSMLRSHAIDREMGGVFDVFKRETDEYMWHTNKAWWQQAEAILALTLADRLALFENEAVRTDSIFVRDQVLKFYFDHFIDYQHGGEFPVVQRDGNPILSENKGQLGTGTYHQVELAREMKKYAAEPVRGIVPVQRIAKSDPTSTIQKFIRMKEYWVNSTYTPHSADGLRETKILSEFKKSALQDLPRSAIQSQIAGMIALGYPQGMAERISGIYPRLADEIGIVSRFYPEEARPITLYRGLRIKGGAQEFDPTRVVEEWFAYSAPMAKDFAESRGRELENYPVIVVEIMVPRFMYSLSGLMMGDVRWPIFYPDNFPDPQKPDFSPFLLSVCEE